MVVFKKSDLYQGGIFRNEPRRTFLLELNLKTPRLKFCHNKSENQQVVKCTQANSLTHDLLKVFQNVSGYFWFSENNLNFLKH